MPQITPAAVTVATVQDTGPRTAVSCCPAPPTEVASIIQMLGREQEVLPTVIPSHSGDCALFPQLSEVKETYEFEDLTVPVKGNLRRHVEFWHSIGAP